jgi:hypothetical protein
MRPWASHGFPRDSIFKIATHFFPGNRLVGSDKIGIALLRNVMKVRTAFCLVCLLRDGLQDV